MHIEKKTFIKDINVGDESDSPFLVLSLSQGRTNRGGTYLNVELGDRTGRMAGKVWDNAEALSPRLSEGTVARIKGYVDSYRGSPQFIIREASPVPRDEIAWSDYLKASSRPLAEMKAELWALVEEIKDMDFRRLVVSALRAPEVGNKFYDMPAAKMLHHAYMHGLLEHSLSVGRLARMASLNYPQLNGSLLLAGALLHDLGKIWEFTPPPKVDYTTLGRLKGHLVMGSEFLGKIAEQLPVFPQDKLELLQHLIVSHHGEPEFGAPVKPQLLEALVLHHLDNIDAKIEAVGSFIETESDADGWSGYHRLFGGYFRRTPEFADPETADDIEPEKPITPDNGHDMSREELASSDAINDDNSDSDEGRLF